MNSDSSPLSWIKKSIHNLTHKGAVKQDINEAIEKISDDLKSVTGVESTSDEKQIIRGLLKFGNTTVRQIMKGRLDVTAFDDELNFHEVLDEISKAGFSRVPVYKDNLDNVIGILNIKDLFPYVRSQENYNWQSLIRPAYFIPESKKIGELLGEFQRKRLHMAIVVDEYGGTSGILTMEDILEEIVGEIADEYDEEEAGYTKVSDDTYVFEGKTSLNDFYKVLLIDPSYFEEVKGESESLAGLLLQLHSDLPVEGTAIRFRNFEFVTEAVSNKTIKKVKVVLIKDEEKQNAQE